MKKFGGPAFLLDKNDINTDEIIPAKYLTEISKVALTPHLLEDLLIDGQKFDNTSEALRNSSVIITRKNFGCGSSREHAVWAFEVNGINLIIAESFARIFRQNMFNCGILAIELSAEDITELFEIQGSLAVSIDVANGTLLVTTDEDDSATKQYSFTMNDFDKNLVSAGGWLEYAENRY